MRASLTTFVLAGLFSTSTALAQSTEDSLLQECFSLRSAGRNAASLPRCEEAVVRFRSGRSLAQLALTEMALERYADAANHFTVALADTQHPWITANQGPLRDALRTVSARVGAVEVRSNVADATVSLGDGATYPCARPVYAALGSVALTLRAPDGRTVTRTLTLRAGELTSVTIDFAPLATLPTPQPRPNVAPPERVPQQPVSVVTPAPVVTTSTQRVLAFTAGGLAFVGLGFSVLSWRLREGVVADYVAMCPDGSSAAGCGAQWDTARDDVSRWETASTVGLIAGGALAVTSVVLFATEPSRRSTTAFRCAPSFVTTGLQCEGRF